MSEPDFEAMASTAWSEVCSVPSVPLCSLSPELREIMVKHLRCAYRLGCALRADSEEVARVDMSDDQVWRALSAADGIHIRGQG